MTASATARNSSRLSAADSAQRLSTSQAAALLGSFAAPPPPPPRGDADDLGDLGECCSPLPLLPCMLAPSRARSLPSAAGATCKGKATTSSS